MGAAGERSEPSMRTAVQAVRRGGAFSGAQGLHPAQAGSGQCERPSEHAVRTAPQGPSRASRRSGGLGKNGGWGARDVPRRSVD